MPSLPERDNLSSVPLKPTDGAPLAEWAVLIECGRPGGEPTRLLNALDCRLNWPNLLKLADDEGMLPLVSAKLADFDGAIIPAEAQQKLRDAFRARALVTLRMSAELFRLLERFAAHGIETLVTKGPALAQRCFGDPAMRQYDDIDLIVRQRDIARTTQVMTGDLGYEPRIPPAAIESEKIPGEYVFRGPQSQLLIEFHTERTFRYHPRPLPVEHLFERQVLIEVDGKRIPALCAEDELTLICIHGAKHFWERLMWTADVAALVGREGLVNPQKALACAREVGAERMLRLGIALAQVVFDMRLNAEFDADLRSDGGAVRLAREIAAGMPWLDSRAPGIFQRALFRVRMRGNVLSGAAYLLRLSFSPTEEDWHAKNGTKDSTWWDAMRRPFRLARKYRRQTTN